MTLLTKIGAFAFETESVQGTAETIVAADVILAEEPSIEISHGVQERAVIRDVPDAKASIPGPRTAVIAAVVEMVGTATQGTLSGPAAVLSDFILACGFDLTNISGHSNTYNLDADLASPNAGTAKVFRDGKQKTALGCMFNPTFSLVPGEIPKMTLDGMGVYSSDGDEATLAAPTEVIQPVVLKDATFILGRHIADVLAEEDDGAVEELRAAAASKVRFGVKIDGSATARDLARVQIKLVKDGTPIGETDGIWVTIEGDNAGAPDDSPITNGTSVKYATTLIPTTEVWWDFDFTGTLPTIPGDSNDYWIVVQGDFTPDTPNNNIELSTDVVGAGDQRTQVFDAAWGALALKNITMRAITSTSHCFITASITPNNEIALKKDPNAAEANQLARITGRRVANTLDVEEIPDATWDFFNDLTAITDLYFAATFGALGNQWKWEQTHAKMVNDSQAWSDADGVTSISGMELQTENPADFFIELK